MKENCLPTKATKPTDVSSPSKDFTKTQDIFKKESGLSQDCISVRLGYLYYPLKIQP
jgi:hypothetical protein